MPTKAGNLSAYFGVSATLSGIKRMALAGSMKHIDAGTRLFSAGDRCENFILVSSGKARVQMATRSGRDITLYRLGTADACLLTLSCLLNQSKYFAEGVSETDLDVLIVPAADFHAALISDPVLMQTIMRDYADRLSGLVGVIDRLTSRCLDDDLADLLRRERNAEGLIKKSHRQIAEDLGTAREVVSRKLKDLEIQGALTLGRGVIRLRKNSPFLKRDLPKPTATT